MERIHINASEGGRRSNSWLSLVKVYTSIPNHKDIGKLQARWRDGVHLGIRMESSEMLIGTSEGVFKVRSIRRKTEGLRWSASDVEQIIGVPWKPYQFTDDDRLLVRMPEFTEEDATGLKEHLPSEDAAPRGIIVTKRDLIKHGYTPNCPGCYSSRHGIKYKSHTPKCRQRIFDSVREDEGDSKRVQDAKEREDAWLERQVRQGEKAPEADAERPQDR